MSTKTSTHLSINLDSINVHPKPNAQRPDSVTRPAISTLTLSRAEAIVRTPILARLANYVYAQLGDEKRGNKKPVCGAVLHAASELQGLLQNPSAGPQALLMMLPREFEPVLPVLAVQEPEIFNYPTVDLQQNLTYLGYSITLPRQSLVTEIWLPERVMCDPLTKCWQAGLSDVVDEQTTTKQLPVIMLAGNSVAVGGFEVTEPLLWHVQAAVMSANSALPEELYPDEELEIGANLASLVGQTPWRRGYWCTRAHLSSWRDVRRFAATECEFFV